MQEITTLYESFSSSTAELRENIRAKFRINDLKSFNDVVLFGAQNLGLKFLDYFKKIGVEISFFSDNDQNKWGKKIHGIEVIPPTKIKGNQIVIITSQYLKEIYYQLEEQDLKQIIPYYVLSFIYPNIFPNSFYQYKIETFHKFKNQIEQVFGMMSDQLSKEVFLSFLRFRFSLLPHDLPSFCENQYFPGDFWQLKDNEIFLDLGAFDGDTFKEFLMVTKGNFNSYVALEPDKVNFGKFLSNISSKYKQKVFVFCKGAGAKNSKLGFSQLGQMDSYIDEASSEKVEIITVDELSKQYLFTTIKVDVEGYENQVLIGAKNAIQKLTPKIAISVYHKTSDLWEIPLKVLKINPDYKFYLRHHSHDIYDTVLYAV